MTVDWFLIDAPHTVPSEFAAWEAAKENHRAIFFRACKAEIGSAEFVALDAAGREAVAEVARLEQIARDAWMKSKN